MVCPSSQISLNIVSVISAINVVVWNVGPGMECCAVVGVLVWCVVGGVVNTYYLINLQNVLQSHENKGGLHFWRI